MPHFRKTAHSDAELEALAEYLGSETSAERAVVRRHGSVEVGAGASLS